MSFVKSDLMKRYLAGETSEKENEIVLKWMMLNLNSRDADEEFESLYESAPAVSSPAIKARVKSRLDGFVRQDRRHRNRRIGLWSVSAAAAVLFVFSIGLSFLYLRQSRNLKIYANWSEVSTSYGEKKSVTLPDGSVIWLHNDTKVIYPDKFVGGSRQIFVKGEVFSDIVPDEDHPFIITDDDVNVVVRGTTFNYKSIPGMNNAEVTLLEGKVEIKYVTEKGTFSIDVNPGERLAIDLISGKVTRQFYNVDEYVSWKDRRALYFNDLSLEQIVLELKAEFNADIVIEDPSIASTRFYAYFVHGESVMQILNTLCSPSGIDVISRGKTIVLKKTTK